MGNARNLQMQDGRNLTVSVVKWDESSSDHATEVRIIVVGVVLVIKLYTNNTINTNYTFTTLWLYSCSGYGGDGVLAVIVGDCDAIQRVGGKLIPSGYDIAIEAMAQSKQ